MPVKWNVFYHKRHSEWEKTVAIRYFLDAKFECWSEMKNFPTDSKKKKTKLEKEGKNKLEKWSHHRERERERESVIQYKTLKSI